MNKKKIFITLDVLLLLVFFGIYIFAPKLYPYMPIYTDIICAIIAIIYYLIRAGITKEPFFKFTNTRFFVTIGFLVAFRLFETISGRGLDDNLDFLLDLDLIISFMAGKLYLSLSEFNKKQSVEVKHS